MALSDPGAVLGAAARQHCNGLPELAGGSDTTYRPTSWNLAGPGPDRLHVVPGHVVETAAAGGRWLAILHRTGIDERGVRVSPHFLEGYRVASHERVWTDCFSCRARIRWVDDARARRALRRRARRRLYA